MADSSMRKASLASSIPLSPEAYRAATKLPADVPATQCGLIPDSSNTWITPMWAKPRAAPPPSARHSRGALRTAGAAVGI